MKADICIKAEVREHDLAPIVTVEVDGLALFLSPEMARKAAVALTTYAMQAEAKSIAAKLRPLEHIEMRGRA